MNRNQGRMVAAALVSAVLLAGGTDPAVADFAYSIDYEGTDNVVKLADGEEGQFKHTYTNTGTEADTYRMICTVDYYNGDFLSFGWTVCTTAACVTPNTETFFSLPPAASDTVTVKIYPFFDVEGSATCTFTFESVGDPGLVTTYRYACIRTGTDVLIIDDDGGASYQDNVADALAIGASSYGVYPTDIQELANIPFSLDDASYVIYLSGDESTNTITTADAAVLSAYLDAGGRLIASGQDLFDDISGSAFASTYLAAERVLTTSETHVDGEVGDPVGDGLSFDITGGAANQVSQDVVAPGNVSLRYGDGTSAGVLYERDAYKTISLGFGLEALAPADASALLASAATWFGTAVVSTPGAVRPESIVESFASPNPMVDRGVIRLQLPDTFSGAVDVSLFDTQGRFVGTVFDDVLAGGRHELPVRVGDLANVSPGVYHYRVNAGALRTSGKVAILN